MSTAAAAAMLVLALAAAAAEEQEPLRVDKCCWKSQYYDQAAGGCVSAPWSVADFTEDEVLEPPLAEEDARWIPPALRSRRIHARYDTELRGHLLALLEADAAAVEELLRVNASAGSFAQMHRFAPGAADARAAWDQTFCFDAAGPAPGPAPVLALSGLLTRALTKCCPPRQRLAESARACVPDPPWAIGKVGEWAPPIPWLNGSGARVAVDDLRFQWNVAVRVSEVDEAVWRLTAPPAKPHFKVWVRGAPRGGGAPLEGVTSAYCFDAVDDGPLAPRALLAVVVKARKCCARDQRLSADSRRCERHPQGAETEAEAGEGEGEGAGRLVGEEPAGASAWLPAAVGRALGGLATVPVLYNASWGLEAATVVDADEGDAWGVDFPGDEEPQLWLQRRTANGTARARAQRFCFDATPGGVRVVVAEAVCGGEGAGAGAACLPKCCPAGQLLDAGARCAEPPAALRSTLPARGWEPSASAAAPFLAAHKIPLARFLPVGSCHARAFELHRLTPQQAARWLEQPEAEERFMNVHRCADLQLAAGPGGGAAEAFASCALPALGPAYARVRPLQLLAAPLLAAALAALLAPGAPARRSVHGAARAAHAACLLLAALLQAGWFLAYRRNDDCENVAFFTYFFLVATGSWLNVMALNLAWKIWRGAGACAGACARAGGARRWRRLAPWAAYGWGLTAALTAAAVAAFLNREALDQAGFVSPSFFETRTCMGEHRLTLDGDSTWNIGAALYYYVPMGILMIVNAACMWCKKSREAAQQKDSMLLEGKVSSGVSVNEMRSAQLLVLSQLVALAAEAAAWAARPPPPPRGDSFVGAWEGSLQSAYTFSLAATALDLARAAAVLALSVDAAAAWGRARARVARWRRGTPDAPTPAAPQDTAATRC